MFDEEQKARIIELKLRLKNDFGRYAPLLEIRTKADAFQRLKLNRTQTELHARLERQREERGYVRAVILKGRQMGCSTYIAGRFYWRVTHREGVRAYVLAHTDPATQNLYGMVQHYHAAMNILMQPTLGKANANELAFAELGSGYKVATAGGKEVGRSDTIQYVHGSEVGFWGKNGGKLVAGLMQTVPKTGETEIVLESTANGLGDAFHTYFTKALKGDSEFEAIFFPWFLHEEYTAPAPDDWMPSEEWAQYGLSCYLPAGITHPEIKQLTRDQLYWAWRESRTLGQANGLTDSDKISWAFRQEYPATASEAFQTGGQTPFITQERVQMARRRRIEGRGPIVLGIDPAREGKDGTGVIDRQGRRMGQRICERWKDGDLMVTAGRVARLIRTIKPAKVFIDVGGIGAGVYDRLVELGFGRVVEAVNFGSAPHGSGPVGPDRYANRRAEIWDSLRDWFANPAGVQCPDSDEFQMDACLPAWGKGATKWDSQNRLVLESKEHMAERVGFSPDLGDAAALTFAADVLASHAYGDDRAHREARRTANNTTGY